MRRFRPAVNLPGLLFALGVVGAWEALCRLGVIDYNGIPAPTEVWSASSTLAEEGALVEPLLHTLRVVATGSGLALLAGLVLGTTLGLSPAVARWSMASVDFLRTIPVVALFPLSIIIWGPTTQAELIITAYAATWVMVVNTAGGFRSVHPRLADVSHTLGLSRVATLRKMWFPALVPSLLVGARLAVVTAVLTAVITESFVNPEGLGWEIIRSQQALQPAELWVYALMAGFLGYLLNLALIVAVRLGSPGGRENPALIGA